MSITGRIRKEAIAFSQRAIERLFSDEKRAMKIAGAIGSVQRGKAVLDKGQEELMRQLNFAPKSDFKAIGKKLSALKRRVRELDEKLEQLGAERV